MKQVARARAVYSSARARADAIQLFRSLLMTDTETRPKSNRYGLKSQKTTGVENTYQPPFQFRKK